MKCIANKIVYNRYYFNNDDNHQSIEAAISRTSLQPVFFSKKPHARTGIFTHARRLSPNDNASSRGARNFLVSSSLFMSSSIT